MGFFSFLNSEASAYQDKVWKDSAHCLKGMITDALRGITEGKVPMVVYHFEKDHEKIAAFLSDNSIPNLFVETGISDDIPLKVVYVCSAKFILAGEANHFFGRLKNQSIHFLFFGHYPIPSKEKKLLEKVELQKPGSITFYSSLDQPSFEVFGAGQIISIMEKLGMKDDEAIDHPLVKKAMERAREKVENSIKTEIGASSEKEWFQKNLKK